MSTPASADARRTWRLRAGIAFVAVMTVLFVGGLLLIDREAALAEVAYLHEQLDEWVMRHPFVASACFFGAYLLFASLSLPGSMFLSLAGGALFGVWWAVLLISFAATAGASVSFLTSRYLLRESMTDRYSPMLERVNRELDRDGVWYLISLRLNPAVPFFLINVLFGLTRMPLVRFWWATQVGMLPANFIFTYAGRQLAESGLRGDFLNWRIAAILIALSIFPIVMRKLANALFGRRRSLPAAAKSGPSDYSAGLPASPGSSGQ